MAHHVTVLRQLLQCQSRLEFVRVTANLDGRRRSDVLCRWSFCLTPMVGHVGQWHSQRDIESALINDLLLLQHLYTSSWAAVRFWGDASWK